MSRFIYKIIWDLSEWSGIGLGKYAEYVFHQMIGGEIVKEQTEMFAKDVDDKVIKDIKKPKH